MKRALLIVLDSVGIGFAPDAADFGDQGANTLGHIRQQLGAEFSIPTLDQFGMAHCEALAANQPLPQFSPTWYYGSLTEQSAGKDTTTGHWELTGAPLSQPFATYESFPDSLIAELEAACGFGFIGNYAQSGTVILEELGAEHLQTGKLILYTSSDSVLQIAAHEESFGLDKLYQVCQACRPIADRESIGRVIARPFIGDFGDFSRTPNRRDFSLQPPPTILNALQDIGVRTVGIGKISDIFAGSGISESYPTKNNQAGMSKIESLWQESCEEPTLYFANLVDFDTLYGHRRDVGGYGQCLEQFDSWLGEFAKSIQVDDQDFLIMITADHGNDPTWIGTDHTREKVALLVNGGLSSDPGERRSFADVAASLAKYFGVKNWREGDSFV